MSIFVKVAQLPSVVKEVALDDGATVADAIETAGLTSDGFTVSLNGSTVTSLSASLSDGDRLVLTEGGIKGGIKAIIRAIFKAS